jgi:hypothetical protein
MTRQRRDHGLGMTTIALTTAILLRLRRGGIANPWDVAGRGTIDVLDGNVYEVVWDPLSGFSLELV